jgi:hypothetical protein
MPMPHSLGSILPALDRRKCRRASGARQADRALRARCSGSTSCSSRTSGARPAKSSRSLLPRLALDSLLTRVPDLPRKPSGTANTDAMLAVGTGLSSYARLPLLPEEALRASSPDGASFTTFALAASEARQASGAHYAWHGLNDDLDRS